jgi:class 3 adenylate cyclase
MPDRGGTDFLFVLCDISGYTRFMTQHREALYHAYVIVSELMQAILRQSKTPLRVMKLEGDAVFLYAPQEGVPEERQRTVRAAVQRVDGAFTAFAAKRQELIESNICPCEACESVDRLRLKVILHAGPAVLHRIGRHLELAGADVILAHRLLKNSVAADEYLLLTEAARHALGPAEQEPWITTAERYEGFDPVQTFIYRAPGGAGSPAPPGHYGTLWLKSRNILKKILQGRLMQLRLLPRPLYYHLGAGGAETGT